MTISSKQIGYLNEHHQLVSVQIICTEKNIKTTISISAEWNFATMDILKHAVGELMHIFKWFGLNRNYEKVTFKNPGLRCSPTSKSTCCCSNSSPIAFAHIKTDLAGGLTLIIYNFGVISFLSNDTVWYRRLRYYYRKILEYTIHSLRLSAWPIILYYYSSNL